MAKAGGGARAGARDAAIDGVGGLTGVDRIASLREGTDAVLKARGEALAFQSFMDGLKACVNGQAPKGCLTKMALEQAKPYAREWLLGIAKKAGSREAAERVEKFQEAYRNYVGKLEEAYQQQSGAASRCLGSAP